MRLSEEEVGRRAKAAVMEIMGGDDEALCSAASAVTAAAAAMCMLAAFLESEGLADGSDVLVSVWSGAKYGLEQHRAERRLMHAPEAKA